MARPTNSKKTPNPANPLSPTSRKTRHREEATERKVFSDAQTKAERLATIAKRPGESKREKARLQRKAAA